MNVRIAARGVAIAVAVAAAIDPTWTTARPERGRLGILVDASPTMSLPASTSGPDTRGQQALAIRDEVVAALADDADIEPYLSPGQDAVLVIGDALRPLPGSTPPVPVWTVTVGSTLSPNVEVESVALPHRVAAARPEASRNRSLRASSGAIGPRLNMSASDMPSTNSIAR